MSVVKLSASWSNADRGGLGGGARKVHGEHRAAVAPPVGIARAWTGATLKAWA